MYDTSEEAIQANETISLGAARAELHRHYCRIVDQRGGIGPLMIEVTNDLDPSEWIPCTTKAVLEWLGY